jgi:hypothetical protein
MYRLEQNPLLGLDSGLMQAYSLWLLNAGHGTHSLRVIVPVSSCGWNDYYQQIVTHVPAVVSWKYDLSPTHQKGVILISRSGFGSYPDYADAPSRN